MLLHNVRLSALGAYVSAMVLPLAACTSSDDATGPPAPVLSSIVVTLGESSLVAGQTTQAAAEGLDQYGAPFNSGPVTWSVGSSAIASVTATGTVTGMGVGQTTVRARSGDVEGSTSLVVVAGPPSQLALVTAAAGVVSGLPFSTQPTVAVRDAFGNTITTDNTTLVTAAVSAGAATIGTAAATATNGEVAFRALGVTGTIGSTYTLTFSSASLQAVSQSVTPSPASFGNGIHRVGIDIPAGLFRSQNEQNASCYWARLNGFGGTTDEIIANGIDGGPAVVAIAPTDRGFETNRCATWMQVTGPGTSGLTAPFDGGAFIVGTDIAPGTWRSDGTGTSCYWARLSGFGGTISEIIANNFGAAPAIVTIQPSDVGFTSSRCGTWSRIG
jgi:Bacterial Ig-like domain (group 2)